ncbi:hypothetical protein K435DRAFT_865965 [Dendrothele bispora CBS 962.96]|uniref:Uncharacterized protein n=1 Tax=Dendrothele bispora (strain CBS 962.96) TaxID=1314807 RepID=A0A4S8LI02_DENBC|nr:hypothetical protein K435DRAFT_865965 [Dendrothele bispora CBS 962.96]
MADVSVTRQATDLPRTSPVNSRLTRGTLKTLHPDAFLSHVYDWAIVNVVLTLSSILLFTLPALVCPKLVTALFACDANLLAYAATYFASYLVLFLLIIGTINNETTGSGILKLLATRRLIPTDIHTGIALSFLNSRRNMVLDCPIVTEGVKPGSHLQIRVYTLGGAGHSQRIGTSSRMRQALNNIGLDDDGNVRRKRMRKAPAKAPIQAHLNNDDMPMLLDVSDSENDDDFKADDTDHDDSESESDFDGEIEISNDELATILTSKTDPSANRKRKTRSSKKGTSKRRRQSEPDHSGSASNLVSAG